MELFRSTDGGQSGTAVAALDGAATADARADGINRVCWDLRHEALPLPRIPGQEADRRAWHDTALSLHDLERTANQAAETVVILGEQLANLECMIGTRAMPDAAKTLFDATSRKVTDLRARLGVPLPRGDGGSGGGRENARRNVSGRITSVKTAIMASTSAPTAWQASQARLLRGELSKTITDLNGVISADMPHLAKALAASSLLPPALPPIKPIEPGS